MSQEVNHRSVTAKTRVRSHVGPHIRFVVNKVTLGPSFYPCTSLFRHYLSINTQSSLTFLYSSLLLSMTSYSLPTVGVEGVQD
jgi:hypothetical protein